MARPPLSPVAEIARAGDPNRFRAAMFAPAERREALFALIAFNHELEKIGWTVSEPMLGEIRLAWWREAVADLYERGTVRGHPVIEALAVEPPADRAALEGMIEARAFDVGVSGLPDDKALNRYLAATEGALIEMMARRLGLEGAATEIATDIGWAEGAGRLIAQALSLILRGLTPFPTMSEADIEAARSGRTSALLASAVLETAYRGRQCLARARDRRNVAARRAMPAFLGAHVADRQLTNAIDVGGDLFSMNAAISPFRSQFEPVVRVLFGRF